MAGASANIECRLAEPADNSAILRFYASHAMQAGMSLRFSRAPEFFAQLNAHSPDNETWLLLEDGVIRAAASLVFRDGYINRAAERVAYLGDLRVSRSNRQVSRLWRQHFRERLARLADEDGIRYAYTGIMRANNEARNALLRTKDPRQPAFSHLRGYSSVSIIARKPLRRPHDSDFKVIRASAIDSDRIRRFIDDESRQQPFGIIPDAATWQRRITSWPNLSVEDFHIAIDKAGKLLGCLAPWDFSALKKIIIDELPTGLQILRHTCNMLAPLTGKPRLSKSSDTGSFTLPDIVLSHVFIHNREPAVFAALLDDAYLRIARSRQYVTVSLCLYDNDPLWPALDRYWHYAVPMDLYSVPLSNTSSPLSGTNDEVPGFEMYLV